MQAVTIIGFFYVRVPMVVEQTAGRTLAFRPIRSMAGPRKLRGAVTALSSTGLCLCHREGGRRVPAFEASVGGPTKNFPWRPGGDPSQQRGAAADSPSSNWLIRKAYVGCGGSQPALFAP